MEQTFDIRADFELLMHGMRQGSLHHRFLTVFHAAFAKSGWKVVHFQDEVRAEAGAVFRHVLLQKQGHVQGRVHHLAVPFKRFGRNVSTKTFDDLGDCLECLTFVHSLIVGQTSTHVADVAQGIAHICDDIKATSARALHVPETHYVCDDECSSSSESDDDCMFVMDM